MSEQKTKVPAFVGPSYTSRAKRFDNQRTINFYAEKDEMGTGKNQEAYVHISRPGLRRVQNIGTGPIRELYTQSNDNISYVVSGNEVYQLTGSLSIPVLIAGNLTTNSGPVQIVDNGIEVLIVDGANGYYITIGILVLNTIVSANFFPTATITYQDGYFIGVQPDSQAFFISDINAVTFPPLNEAFAQGQPDILVTALSCNRQLYLLGAKSQETWFDEGASGSTPFVRQDGRFSQQGCVAAQSAAIINEGFCWLGTNAQGGGIVYTIADAMPSRISTHAVEFRIQSLGTLTAATAFSFQIEGHYFYVLNIPGANTSWVYDMASGLWFEWQSTINGVSGRWIAETHCLLNGQHLVGDYRNGNVYVLDLDYYKDDTNEFYTTRTGSPMAMNGFNIFYKLFEADWQFGVGLPDDGINTASSVDPRVALLLSNDGGETFGNPLYSNLGAIGKYNTRCRFNRLGYSRDRVFTITCSEPVKRTLLGAWVDFEVGNG